MIEPVCIKKLLIVGAGGFGREVAWLAQDALGPQVKLSFAVERAYFDLEMVDGMPVVALDAIPKDIRHYVIAIGDPSARMRFAAECDALGLSAATLVHPSVLHSARVEIGPGSILCAGTILTTGVCIGRHVHLNLACTVGHDVDIADFVTISPGVHVSGNVLVEEAAFIGTGANLINGKPGDPLIIGARSVVAAGACVTKPVDPGALVAGVPAVRKR